MEEWFVRLDPDHVTIIGGEPLIHPRIYDILKEARRIFDHATIEIYTNGFLLPKRPDLLKTLKKIGHAKVSCSIHNRDPEVRKLIEKNLWDAFYSKGSWTYANEGQYVQDNVMVEVTDPTTGGWYDYRRVVDGQLKPWDDRNPIGSYGKCGVATYPIIYKKKLYKCPPISMLRTHLTKTKQLNDIDWSPYLQYKGLAVDCSANELEEFVDNIFKPHKICAMCPANPELKPQEEAVIKNVKLL